MKGCDATSYGYCSRVPAPSYRDNPRYAGVRAAHPVFYRSDYALNYAQLGEMGSVVIADLNNDGKMDFAVGAGFGIAIALGNGDGTFQPITIVVPAGAGINGVWTLSPVAADLDGDGNVDLVLRPEGGEAAALAILPAHGDGTFGSAYLVYAGPQGQYDGLDQVNLDITNLPALHPPRTLPRERSTRLL
ncbi:MAG TPA: VCBS repeat-containing protein [Bryobacteraceae bacterium]